MIEENQGLSGRSPAEAGSGCQPSASATSADATASSQSGIPNAELYCMHVLGMDDVHPAPDRATAQLWAAEWTVFWHFHNPDPRPFDPIISFVVAPWPWAPESHAAGLQASIEANAFEVSPLAQAIEARRAATAKTGAVEDESAVGNADAPETQP